MKDEQKIVTKIQPNVKNLWIVTREPILGDYINYAVQSAYNSKYHLEDVTFMILLSTLILLCNRLRIGAFYISKSKRIVDEVSELQTETFALIILFFLNVEAILYFIFS